jgi:hypothetical protein
VRASDPEGGTPPLGQGGNRCLDASASASAAPSSSCPCSCSCYQPVHAPPPPSLPPPFAPLSPFSPSTTLPAPPSLTPPTTPTVPLPPFPLHVATVRSALRSPLFTHAPTHLDQRSSLALSPWPQGFGRDTRAGFSRRSTRLGSACSQWTIRGTGALNTRGASGVSSRG